MIFVAVIHIYAQLDSVISSGELLWAALGRTYEQRRREREPMQAPDHLPISFLFCFFSPKKQEKKNIKSTLFCWAIKLVHK